MFATILGDDIDTEWSQWLVPWRSIPQSTVCHVKIGRLILPRRSTLLLRKRTLISRLQVQLSIYLLDAMMSFVSGYYDTGPRQHRRSTTIRSCILLATASRKFTSVERLNGAVVKFPWNFDRNYPSCPYARPRRYFSSYTSFSFVPRESTWFIPMKLSTPSRNIRFRPWAHRAVY